MVITEVSCLVITEVDGEVDLSGWKLHLHLIYLIYLIIQWVRIPRTAQETE